MTRSRLLLVPLATMLGACAGPSTAPTAPAAPQLRSASAAAPSADETTTELCRGGYTVASALTSCP